MLRVREALALQEVLQNALHYKRRKNNFTCNISRIYYEIDYESSKLLQLKIRALPYSMFSVTKNSNWLNQPKIEHEYWEREPYYMLTVTVNMLVKYSARAAMTVPMVTKARAVNNIACTDMASIHESGSVTVRSTMCNPFRAKFWCWRLGKHFKFW